jgi:hypothetical protein
MEEKRSLHITSRAARFCAEFPTEPRWRVASHEKNFILSPEALRFLRKKGQRASCGDFVKVGASGSDLRLQ